MWTDLSWRPFGNQLGDLDIYIRQDTHPQFVTDLLCYCAPDSLKAQAGDEYFWQLTVGQRVISLLEIAALDQAGSNFIQEVKCPNPECLRLLDVELSLDQLKALSQVTNGHDLMSYQFGDTLLTLRRPTGFDQLSWQNNGFSDEITAKKDIIRTLLVPPDSAENLDDMTPECISALSEAMSDFDPLVDFRLKIKCPFCEQENNLDVDLQEVAIDRFRRAQARLTKQVHQLALNYHWSEEHIFKLPSWRRERYLALLERDHKL